MPTLKSIVLGNISVELKYIVEAGEEQSDTSPGVDAEIHFGEAPGDMVAVIDGCLGLRIDIELDGYICNAEWERLELEAWEYYMLSYKDEQ